MNAIEVKPSRKRTIDEISDANRNDKPF